MTGRIHELESALRGLLVWAEHYSLPTNDRLVDNARRTLTNAGLRPETARVRDEDLREARRNLAHVHAWFLRECAAAPDSGEVVDAGSRAAFERLCDAAEVLDRAINQPWE